MNGWKLGEGKKTGSRAAPSGRAAPIFLPAAPIFIPVRMKGRLAPEDYRVASHEWRRRRKKVRTPSPLRTERIAPGSGMDWSTTSVESLFTPL